MLFRSAIYNRLGAETAADTTLVFVGDPERCAQFGPGFRQYNGQQMRTGYYKFKDVVTVENTDAADIRATDVRSSVKNGDFAKFQQLTGTKGDLAKRIFDAVAVGMNAATGKKALKESIDGEEMLKILQQTHHEPIVNDEMIDWIKDHRWGVKMIQPKEIGRAHG